MAYASPLADGFASRRYTQPIATSDMGYADQSLGGAAQYYDGGPNQLVNSAPSQPNPYTSTPPAWNQPNVTATAPAPIQAFGPTPSVNPTYADPNQNLGYMQQYMQLLNAATAPQFQQQQQTLDDQLASRGVTGGAAQYLTNQLTGEQAGAYASAAQPIVSQGYGYTQQDIQGNQAAANNAAAINANYYGGALSADYGAYNNYLNELLNMGGQNYAGLQGAYLNSFGPNTGVTSAYNTATGGIGSTFGNVFNSANNAQGSALSGAFGAAGQIFGNGG